LYLNIILTADIKEMLQSFLLSALDIGEWSVSHSMEKGHFVFHYIREWVESRNFLSAYLLKTVEKSADKVPAPLKICYLLGYKHILYVPQMI